MKGKVLVYSEDVSAGMVQTPNGKTYYFLEKDWVSQDVKPRAGQTINFGSDGTKAHSVMLEDVEKITAPATGAAT